MTKRILADEFVKLYESLQDATPETACKAADEMWQFALENGPSIIVALAMLDRHYSENALSRDEWEVRRNNAFATAELAL